MSAEDPPPSKLPESSTTGRLPTAKITAVGRLKSFTGSLIHKHKPKPEFIFPPPSWDIRDFYPASTDWTIAPPEPLIPPEDAQAANAERTPSPTEAVEPITFAKRLRGMIQLLPIPGNLVPSPFSGTTTTETLPTTEPPAARMAQRETPPIPPDMDKNLIRMLSSEEVMNGDSDGKGKDRPSIWSLLTGLRSSDDGSKQEELAAPVEEQESGVMMYAPIDPDSDSVVELARTETVKSTDQSTVTRPSPSNPSLPSETEIRLWVPSTTAMSVLTTWWGYRLYLPPPVMARLGATTVMAAGRAAMITSALKWLIDKIPLLIVPVQFRPAIKMLKTLAPAAGYVGVFIAWSWDRIRTYDQGNGVVLTATWLLPVALMPMAWDAGDIYGPAAAPEVEEQKDEGKDKSTLKKSRF